MKRRRNVQEEAACEAAGSDRHTATRPPGWLLWWSDTPVIRRPEAAGSLPELGVGEWMRLMLLCCTWKDERMGEEEGKGSVGEKSFMRRRWGGRCRNSSAFFAASNTEDAAARNRARSETWTALCGLTVSNAQSAQCRCLCRLYCAYCAASVAMFSAHPSCLDVSPMFTLRPGTVIIRVLLVQLLQWSLKSWVCLT